MQKSSIIFQDEFIIVANKAAGVLSQPDRSGALVLSEEIKAMLRIGSNDFLAPAHRLDRNTSGLLILARTSAAAAALKSALEAGEITRTYHAIVKGDPGESGVIDAPLVKVEAENRSYISEEGQTAITHFNRVRVFATCSLVELKLETGRSHQIRAHMAHIRHPLVGDQKYGSKNWAKLLNRPALHARELSFSHPITGKAMNLYAPYPNDIEELISRLAIRDAQN